MCSGRYPKRHEPRLRRNHFSGILSWQSFRLFTCPSTSHLRPCLVDPMAFSPAKRRHFYPVGKALSCPGSALLDDDTVQGLDCSSLTLGEARVVSCADGDTAAGDTDVRFRSRTVEHVTERFYSTMQVGAVRHWHTHASFHGDSRMPEHSLRGVLHRQLLVLQSSDFRDRVFYCIDLQFPTEPW